jgi:hypothetical protein
VNNGVPPSPEQGHAQAVPTGLWMAETEGVPRDSFALGDCLFVGNVGFTVHVGEAPAIFSCDEEEGTLAEFFQREDVRLLPTGRGG